MKKLYSLIIACMCLSCDGTSDSYKKSSRKSLVKEVIDKNIEEMGKKPWDKAVYLDILNNQINTFKGTSNAKSSLQKNLDFTYGKVLVRDANDILDHCDKNKHNSLSKLLKELALFPNAKDKDEVDAKYKKHEEMMLFVSSMYQKQNVKTLSVSYDESFENTISSKANNYLSANPTCSYIKSALSNTKSIFDQRRIAFATALTDLYCKGSSYDSRIELSVKGKLNDALRNVRKGESEKQQLFEKMKSYKDKFTHK